MIEASLGVSSNYETIWKRLDTMYDSDWMVANATIENLFQLQHPLPNFKSIDQYWYEAGKAATGVADLEFTGKEVVNYIIQTLPGDF